MMSTAWKRWSVLLLTALSAVGYGWWVEMRVPSFRLAMTVWAGGVLIPSLALYLVAAVMGWASDADLRIATWRRAISFAGGAVGFSVSILSLVTSRYLGEASLYLVALSFGLIGVSSLFGSSNRVLSFVFVAGAVAWFVTLVRR